MNAEIQRNLIELRLSGKLTSPDVTQAVAYNFPLRLTPGLPDYAGYRVSAFADHDSLAGILDYNGGNRTYDGHRATDYALYPFGWNKLDAGDVQVLAAASGTIIAKANVDATDHNCNSASNDPWNYVALTHADGRMTIYGHMRYNSITNKNIGQAVTQGEYLGTAASSGNSSGAHLHFEVRTTSYFTTTEWIDPYAGPNSQPTSLWNNQLPYYDAGINKISTHSAPPSTPDPCLPSTLYLEDNFTTPANIYFYTYYRDYHGPLATQFVIYRPDNSVYQSWQDVPSDNTLYSAMYRAAAYSFTSNDPAGTWKFQATYNSQTYQSFFNLNAPTIITVASPNGGEQWARGVGHWITWSDNLGGDVNIALYRNGVFNTALAYNFPSTGAYLWTPLASLTLGTGYSIRVTSVSHSTLFDTSDLSFNLISSQPVFLPLLQR